MSLSDTSSSNKFQLFHPMGGVKATEGCDCTNSVRREIQKVVASFFRIILSGYLG
jgi:hypothetical protein